MNLINENPIKVSAYLANKLGLNEAIVIGQVKSLIQQNKLENKQDYFFNDRWWTCNSCQQLQEMLPFWSHNTIKRTISNLEKRGVLLSTQHSANKLDRTKWYSIDHELLNSIEVSA